MRAGAARLIPGVSRSGATIAGACSSGLRRDAAARFTFLLAIPTMVAAAGKEALELRHMTLAPGPASCSRSGCWCRRRRLRDDQSLPALSRQATGSTCSPTIVSRSAAATFVLSDLEAASRPIWRCRLMAAD